MNSFEQKVLAIVRLIPEGRVMSYGQIALYTGNPEFAREVGEAMGALGKSADFIPWWRVINNAGKISIDNPDATPEMQQELLAKEGVQFVAPFELDMDCYRVPADEPFLKSLGLEKSLIELALKKYGPRAVTQSLNL